MDEKTPIKTKHGELTLEQLAEAQPGMARLMKEIGERYHVLFYAAKAGNWELAQHELNVTNSILKTASTLRPKYAHDITSFTKSHLNKIGEKIRSRNWKEFEVEFSKGIEEANRFHEKYGYGFIRYVLSKKPPEAFDLASHE
jgi:hypothetical protein